MKRAIDLAKQDLLVQGWQLGEVPIGAVLVVNDEIVAESFNEMELVPDPTAHAEITCIRKAAKALGRWRLHDSVLYATLEPCPMCAGAILQARIPSLVYGARNNLLGADGSWVNLLQYKDNVQEEEQIIRALRPHPFHPQINVTSGVLAEECSQLMKDFFRASRQREKLKQNGDLKSDNVGSEFFEQKGNERPFDVLKQYISLNFGDKQ